MYEGTQYHGTINKIINNVNFRHLVCQRFEVASISRIALNSSERNLIYTRSRRVKKPSVFFFSFFFYLGYPATIDFSPNDYGINRYFVLLASFVFFTFYFRYLSLRYSFGHAIRECSILRGVSCLRSSTGEPSANHLIDLDARDRLGRAMLVFCRR